MNSKADVPWVSEVPLDYASPVLGSPPPLPLPQTQGEAARLSRLALFHWERAGRKGLGPEEERRSVEESGWGSLASNPTDGPVLEA